MMNILPPTRRVQETASLVEGNSINSIVRMTGVTRLASGFSKKIENHGYAVALHFMHYNFCRVHKILRVTPAMEAGLTNHVWTLEELCALLPERKPNARIDKELILKALNKTA